MAATPSSPVVGHSRRWPPFVGRACELAGLHADLDAALQGHGRLTLLVGEPGIGKTRLAEELADEAVRRGAVVAWGRSNEWEGAPAYWPWTQALRTISASFHDEVLATLSASEASMLAQIMPDLSARVPDLPALPEIEPAQARFRLIDGVTRFLLSLARTTPLLLVLDDLHWADAPSLLLLQFLNAQMAEHPILIVGTYRHVEVGREHPLSATLAELVRLGNVRRVFVPGLTETDVASYASQALGQSVPATLVSALYRETDGNPFFTAEVVRLLASRGELRDIGVRGDWAPRIPESVRDVIARRLDRLSPSCNELLGIASVIGRDFTLPLLARVSGRSLDDLLVRLDEALQSHVVQETSGPGHYRFAHALIRETRYAELSSAHRMRLHLDIARALEGLLGGGKAQLAELAHHFVQAAPLGAVQQALDYSVAAASQEMERFAWEDATVHYQRALQILDLRDTDDGALRIDLLTSLSTARMLAGDAAGANEARRQAIPLVRRHGTPQQFARVALLGSAHGPWSFLVDRAETRDLLEHALAILPDEDAALRVQVMARLASALALAPGSFARRKALHDDALALASQLHDRSLRGTVLHGAFNAFIDPDQPVMRQQLAAQLEALANESGESVDRAAALLARTRVYAETGQMDAARQHLTAARDLLNAAALGRPWEWGYILHDINWAFMEGRFQDVERLVGDALLVGQRVHPSERRPQYQHDSMLYLLRREQGRLADSEPVVSAYLRANPNDYYWLARAVFLHAEIGRLDAARMRLAELVASGFAGLQGIPRWDANLPPLAESCQLLSATDAAQLLYPMLEPLADSNLNELTFCYGAGSYFLGILDTVLGRLDAGRSHFEHALAFHLRMKAPVFVARTLFAYAQLLLQHGTGVDSERATDMLRESRTMAHEIGMVRLLGQIDALGPPGGTRFPSTRSATAGLSERELDVLRLLVEGHSDREIAATLCISHRTVTTHVTNILKKLSVESRTAAATYAVRNGLV